jgi:hypothetical protein
MGLEDAAPSFGHLMLLHALEIYLDELAVHGFLSSPLP